MMMSPFAGVRERSTTSRSLSRMPAPIIESPSTLTKNVAAGRFTSSSFRSSGGSRYCSAGDGNPAHRHAAPSGASLRSRVPSASLRCIPTDPDIFAFAGITQISYCRSICIIRYASRQNIVRGFCFATSAWLAMNARLFSTSSSNVTGSKSLTSTPTLSIRERRAISGQ